MCKTKKKIDSATHKIPRPALLDLMSPQHRGMMLELRGLSPETVNRLKLVFSHLRVWFVLTKIDYPATYDLLDVSEKRRSLLAYKYLDMVWFDRIPDENEELFEIYISLQDSLSRIQNHEIISTFEMSEKQLTKLCEDISSRPKAQSAELLEISISRFPG